MPFILGSSTRNILSWKEDESYERTALSDQLRSLDPARPDWRRPAPRRSSRCLCIEFIYDIAFFDKSDVRRIESNHAILVFRVIEHKVQHLRRH